MLNANILNTNIHVISILTGKYQIAHCIWTTNTITYAKIYQNIIWGKVCGNDA